MSLVQFLRILAARKAIILATLLACFIAATITVQLLPARYEASNRVLIDVTRQDAFTSSLSQGALGSYIATQLKLIKDVQTAGLVVDALGWAADPGNQAAFEAAGRPGGDIRDWLAQGIVANTEAQFQESSSILEISYRGTDPVSTQAIAQAIREAFLKMNRDQRVNTATRTSASYEEQAKRALEEVANAERAHTQYAKDHGIILQPGNIDLESAKLSALSSATTMPAGELVKGEPPNPQMALLRERIAQAEQTLGPNHPTYQGLLRQLAALESEEAKGRAGQVKGLTRADIEAAYEAQKARVLAQADDLDRLSQMQADIAVKRDQYQKLLSRAEELQAIALAGDSNLEPLGNTSLPNDPIWPNKPLVILGSIGLGAVLGILLALLVELLARRVRSEDDLEFAAGAPVLAVVGQERSEDSLSSRMLRIIDRDGARRGPALSET